MAEENQKKQRNRDLGQSFRQARRESFVIIGAWFFFLVWTALVCGLGSTLNPEEPVKTVLGMPRWVFFGVVLPWIVACLFTLWFSMFFMKDTDLDPDRESPEEGEQ